MKICDLYYGRFQCIFYCVCHFQRKWISSLAHFYVFSAKICSELMILIKPDFWARLKMFFRTKKFRTFSLVFRPNLLPKSYRVAIMPLRAQTLTDGCINNIYVPYGCTYAMCLFYEIIVLNMENILYTQIMQKFYVYLPLFVLNQDYL